MKLPGKQKRGGKRRRSASPGDEVEGCDNPAFQASMLEVAVGEGDINASLSVESPPPIPPPRYRNKPSLHRNIMCLNQCCKSGSAISRLDLNSDPDLEGKNYSQK